MVSQVSVESKKLFWSLHDKASCFHKASFLRRKCCLDFNNSYQKSLVFRAASNLLNEHQKSPRSEIIYVWVNDGRCTVLTKMNLFSKPIPELTPSYEYTNVVWKSRIRRNGHYDQRPLHKLIRCYPEETEKKIKGKSSRRVSESNHRKLQNNWC